MNKYRQCDTCWNNGQIDKEVFTCSKCINGDPEEIEPPTEYVYANPVDAV